LTKIFTPFCRSRRDDSKYVYFVGSHKVFFYYNYIIGGKNPKIDQIRRVIGTYLYFVGSNKVFFTIVKKLLEKIRRLLGTYTAAFFYYESFLGLVVK
jgi:hypothetical protein